MDSSNSSEIDDRLSSLPDSLILEILSLLPMKDVVATMLLSKRWLHLWSTVPCLNFDRYLHPLFLKKELLHKHYEFVRGALAHWKGSKIEKFRLTFCIDDESIDASVAIFDSMLLFAVEKQVEELHVFNDVSWIEYCPPQRLYSCSSITKMLISSCKLRIEEAVQWNLLESLEIVGLDSLSEDAMNRILAGAPLLEELIWNIVDCSENMSFRSTSLKKLKFGSYYATLFEEELRIWAPNLLELEISGYFYGSICLLDVPSLTNAELSFQKSSEGETFANLPPLDEMFHQVFRSICHVEKLTLSGFNIKTLLSMKQNGFLVEFTNAKSLYLHVGEAEEMLGVLEMFPNLTTLWVQIDVVVYCQLEKYGLLSKAALPSPSLLYLERAEITWLTRDASIIPAIEILLQNAHLLEKMVFRPKYDRELRVVVEEKVLSLQRSSPTAEVIIVIKDFDHLKSYI